MRGFFNGWGGSGCAEFFAEDGVGRVVFFDFEADEFFGGAVGGGDRAVVGFVVGADAGVEVAEGDASGAVGQVGGKGEEGGEVHELFILVKEFGHYFICLNWPNPQFQFFKHVQ